MGKDQTEQRPAVHACAAFGLGRDKIVHTCAQSYRHLTVIEAGAAAAVAEVHKSSKFSMLSNRVHFVIVGLETIDSFGHSVLRLLEDIVRRIRSRTGACGARTRLFKLIASAVQLGNAACIYRGPLIDRDRSVVPDFLFSLNYIPRNTEIHIK